MRTGRPKPVAPIDLRATRRVERSLPLGSAHLYALRLRSGEFAHIAVDQRGVDVTVSLEGPRDQSVASLNAMDDEYRREDLVVIADGDGEYVVGVRPAPEARNAGRYVITVQDVRAATAADRVALEAERAFTRGRQTRDAGRAATWREALDLFATALTKYRQIGDRCGEMKSLLELGITQYYLSQAEALSTAQAAALLALDLDDRAAAARALKSVGNTLVFQGELPAAIHAFEQSTALSHAIGHRSAEARSLNDAGIAYRRLGDVERAVAAYERALPLARATHDRQIEGNIIGNLGVAYRSLGDYPKALAFYDQALANRRAVGDRRGEYNVLLNAGNLHRQLGHIAAANRMHEAALRIARESGDRQREAYALAAIGLTAFERAQYDVALAYQHDALRITRELGDWSGQIESLEGIGRTLHRRGELDESRTILEEALALTRRVHERYAERDVLGDLAEVARDAGRLDDATQYIAASADLDETLRSEITSPELRTSFVAAEQNRYEQYVEILERRHAHDPTGGDAARALDVSERARARVLLDSLLEARVDLRDGVDPDLLARERGLERQLNDASARLARALATGAAAAESATIEERVNRLTREHQDLLEQIRRQGPRYASAALPRSLSTTEIQERILDDDTVLLEFMLGDARSWLWAVTRNDVVTVPLPARPVIERAVRALYRDLSARQHQASERADAYLARVERADARIDRERAALSDLLLGGIAQPLRDGWRAKRLAIVATGVLEYVPFASLVLPAPGGSADGSRSAARSAAARRELLVARHEIVNLPSASVLDALRRDRPPRASDGANVAVLADPVFEVSDPRVRGRRDRPDAVVASVDRRTSNRTRGAGLGRLPFSRDEAAAIASLVPRGHVFLATDFRASRATAVSGTLRGYSVVHFATHGVFDAASPAMSGLVLSLVDEQGGPQNGFVRLNDIYTMRLDADLVILSACRTALGQEIRGEGLVGIARAFMHAGAPRVIASLWQVSDVATAELMKRFYRGLFVEHLAPAAALRSAQRELSRDPRWSAPFYWAGFVLQGDWRD